MRWQVEHDGQPLGVRATLLYYALLPVLLLGLGIQLLRFKWRSRGGRDPWAR